MILQIIWLWKDLKYLKDHVMLFDVRIISLKTKEKKTEKSNIVHLMAKINKIRMRYFKTPRKHSIRMRIPRLPYPVLFLLSVVFPGGYTLSPAEGTWYQRYPTPLEGAWYQRCSTTPCGQTPVKTLPSRNFVN